MLVRLLPSVAIFLLGSAAFAEPALTVSPKQGIYDAPFEVQLKDAPPDSMAVIKTSRATDDGEIWMTTGAYKADEAGRIDAAKMPSRGGSYTGVSPHGLLCSALPSGVSSFDDYLELLVADPSLPRLFVPPIGPVPIKVEASINGKIVATATAVRGHAINVAEEEVRTEAGLRGLYFAPDEGQTVREPVLLLNGSGGGVRRYAAARLASHGHPTFAFAIYNYADLPTTLKNYPIERIRDAAHWLAQRAGVERVAVMGVSRGSEAAAHAAINFPEAFSAVILSVPSHLREGGALGPDATTGDSAWTIGGKPLAVTDLGFTFDDPRIFEAAKELPGFNASGMSLSVWGSEDLEAEFGTNFEAIDVPVLILAGAEDGIWPSWISAERIRRRMVGAGKGNLVDVRTYAGAGHSLVSVGFGGPSSVFAYNPFLKGYMDFGGTPNGNCDAGSKSSRAIVEFLETVDHPE